MVGLVDIQKLGKAKAKPRGRPKLAKGKSKVSVITLRVLPAERKSFDKAAKKSEQTLSDWARNTLLQAANLNMIEKSGGSGSPTPSE